MHKEVRFKVHYADEQQYMESVLVAGIPIGGIIASMTSNDTIHLERLYVTPQGKNRRNGIGSTMHSHLLHWGELNDAKRIETELVSKNPKDYPTVVNFLEKIGYISVASFYDRRIKGIRKFGFVLELSES